jgi:hypothetical protein
MLDTAFRGYYNGLWILEVKLKIKCKEMLRLTKRDLEVLRWVCDL